MRSVFFLSASESFQRVVRNGVTVGVTAPRYAYGSEKTRILGFVTV